MDKRAGLGGVVIVAVLAAVGAAAPLASARATRIGIIYSGTGALSGYGPQFREGFEVGLAYATNGAAYPGPAL